MRTTTIFAQTHTSERTMSPTGLFKKYLLLVTFETNDNYSIRFEMKKNAIRTALEM